MKPKAKAKKKLKAGKARKALKAKPSKSAKASASGREWSPEMAGIFKPLKKPITLRLDADLLAWFKVEGRGYQTRINKVLRKLMMDQRRKKK